MSEDPAMNGGPRKCGAKTRSGGSCGRPAGSGTDHVGFGRCKHHTGSTPTGVVTAAREVGEALAQNYGGQIEIAPLDALLHALYASAGATAWLRAQVEGLESDELTGPVGGGEHSEPRAEPHVWIRLYADERDRLARTAKLCLDAGVAERQVRLAERYGEMIARLLSGVLDELGLTDAQQRKAREVVPRHLALLETGQPKAA